MAKMRAETKALREAVKHIEGAWVRVFKDGTRWAGTTRSQTRAGMLEVKMALEAAGFQCECRGTPGTSGEFIVDIV